MNSDIAKAAVKNGAMLLAIENWPEIYNKAPEQHAELLKQTVKMQLLLRRYFKNLAAKAPNLINKAHYEYQLAQSKLSKETLDYNVDVIVNDDQIDDGSGQFIQINYQTVKDMTVAGAMSGPSTYGYALPLHANDKKFQQAAMRQVAGLVGKKVLPDGSIVDNPNPDYNVLDTVRDDIAEAIKTSLAMGETTDEAVARVQDIIDDPTRADMIARTESVRAYNAGIGIYGDESGAVGKEWMTAGATDECDDNSEAGVIPIEDDFPSGDPEPPAHPYCRCADRLVYPEEMARQDISADSSDFSDGGGD